MVEFSAAQITPRHFPGKAIDLLDAAAARARQRAYAHLPEATRDLLQQLGEARRQQEESVVQQAFEEAARWRDEVHRLEEELGQAAAEAGPIEVTEEDVRDVVRMWGGGNGREG
jgi:ATP-dependent Clp protease ATP-binding subunit ClpA